MDCCCQFHSTFTHDLILTYPANTYLLKVNNRNTRTKIGNMFKVALVSLLLSLKTYFIIILGYFYCATFTQLSNVLYSLTVSSDILMKWFISCSSFQNLTLHRNEVFLRICLHLLRMSFIENFIFMKCKHQKKRRTP